MFPSEHLSRRSEAMGRSIIVRSFLTGLGVAIISTACGSDSVSGPQSPSNAAVGAQGSAAAGDTTVAAPVDTTPPDSIAAAALAAAAESPPPAPAPAGPTGPPQPAITRKQPLKKSVTTTQVIGPKGGKIKIGQVGLTVVFSKGALLQNTKITITADAGSLISYEFGPHGTQFSAPVAIEQDMQQTTAGGNTAQASNLYGGYMPDGTSDIARDSASVSEMHKAQTSVGTDDSGKPQLKQSVFVVWHFSGYILIGARR